MDEKQKKLIEKWLSEGKPMGWIMSELNVLGLDYDKKDLTSFVSEKKKSPQTPALPGIDTELQKSQDQDFGGSESEDTKQEYFGPLSLDESRSRQYESDVRSEEQEASSMRGSDDAYTRLYNPLGYYTEQAYEGLKNWWEGPRYIDSDEFKNSGVDLIKVASEVRRRTDDITQIDISDRLRKNEEFQKELREVREKYAVGNIYTDVDRAGLSSAAERGGAAPYAQSMEDLPQTEYTSTADTLEAKVTEVRSKYAEKEYANELESIGQQIIDTLPEEVKENKEALKEITDEIWRLTGNGGGIPIDVNLDGDGIINKQPFVFELIDSFSGGVDSIIEGLADGVTSLYVESTQGTQAAKEWAKKTQEQKWATAGGERLAGKGFTDLYQDGDIWGGTHVLMSNVAGAVPSVALAVGGGGYGMAILGLSGAGSANVEALSNPDFTGLGRLGYVFASGVSDAVSARVNQWVFKRALRGAARAGTRISFQQALRGGSKPALDYLKFQAFKYGPPALVEGAEEWAVAITQDFARETGQGRSWTIDRIFRPEIIEQALVGSVIGVGTTATGSIMGRSSFLAQRHAETAREVSALENKAAELDKQAELSTSESDARSLRIQAQSARNRASEVREARAKFYRVVLLRNKEAYDRYAEIDNQIYDITSKLDKDDASPEARKELESNLESLIKTRIDLDAGFYQDNMDLTNGEMATLMRDSGEAYLNNIKEDLAAARQVLKDFESEKKPNKRAVANAKQNVKDLVNARRRFQRIQKKYDALHKELESLDPVKDSEVYDNVLDQIDQVIEKAAGVTGFTVETFGGLNSGQYLAVQDQINERYLSQWTQENIEGMENGTLSREAIEAVLTSDNFAMLTGENPNAKAVSNRQNERYNTRAKEWLASRGLKFHEIVGRYGAGEKSFLVEGMTKKQAAEFAKTFGQESVAHRDGLVLSDGSVQKFDGQGPSFIDGIDGDFFSALKDSDGNITAFQFNLTENYEDADGNEISKEEFNNRIKENEQSVEDIESAIESEIRQGRTPGGEIEQTTDGPGYVTVPRVGKSPNATEGFAGIDSAEDAKAINNLQRLLDFVIPGKGVEIRIITDPGSAKNIQDGMWGGLWKDGHIYINPAAIRANAIAEQAAAEQAGKRVKVKSLKETLQEEVMHAIIGNSLSSLYNNDKTRRVAQKLEARLINIAGRSGVEGFKNRLVEKRRSYLAKGRPDSEVFEEVVIEFLSTLAANPDIKISFVDKAVFAFNGMLASAYGSKVANGFNIADAGQLIQIAKKFADAQSKGETFKLDSTDADVTDPDGEKESGRIVLPNRIPASKDGKIRVQMNIPVYRWSGGVKKDIGTETITKEFNDQWHFANWWKKTTKGGTESYYTGFRTEGGDTIDVDRINTWGSRSSARLSPVSQRIDDTVFKAIDQGIISRAVGQRMRNKMRSTFSKMDTEAKRNGTETAVYKGYVERLNQYEEYIEQLIQREAKRLRKEFDPGESEAKASARLQEYIVENAKSKTEISSDFNKLDRILTTLTGESPRDRVVAHQLMRQYISQNMAHMSPAQRLSILAGSYLGPEGRERVEKFFGSENPVNFFDNYNKASDERIDSMINDGRLVGNKEDLKMRLNFIMAFTSAQSNASRNVEAAFAILEYANKRRDQMPPGHIVPIEIIRAIEGKVTVDGFDRNLISPRGWRGASSQFRKLNALLSGKEIKMPSAYGNKQVNDHVEKYGAFVLEDGSINWESLLTLMLTEYGTGSKNVRKGKREYVDPLTGEIIQESVQWMGQEMFSPKLGTWAMNLSNGSFPNLSVRGSRGRNNTLMDAVTVDTHVLNTMALIIGKPYDAEALMMQNLARLHNYMNGGNATPKQLGLEGDGRMVAARKIINEANETINYRRKNGYEVETLTSYKAEAISPKVELTAAEKQLAAQIINDVAYELEITPAQMGQLLFADRQVQNAAYLGQNWNDPNPKSSAIENSYSTYAAEMEGEVPTTLEPSLSSADASMEARASDRLIPPTSKSQRAEDSPLYRTRDAAEALMFRGQPLDDDVISEALSTDAVSRRIMAKDYEVSDGQKVGIRLNLNVMKNTGVPVQTMHDKTASGEALRYAAAVMVKNPTLFVNQNARRKIMTFQENKFPMASVNGEFITDNLSQMDYNGVKAFFNPFSHNVFVDASGRPIKSADEATIVGSTVFLRGNIEYYDFTDPILSEGRQEKPIDREKRVKRGDKYNRALSRFEAYSKRQGIEFSSRADLEAAYDNMPMTSRVALNESEVAANMEEAQTRASSRLKIRQTAGRAARHYTGDTRKQIINNPNNYFTPQVLKNLKRDLGKKSDAELIDIMTDDGLGRLSQRNDDLGVLAAGELINRAVARGDMDSISGLIEEAAAMGTTAGRILRHLRELKGSTPKGIEQIIIKAVEKRGNKLSDDQKSRLQQMASDMFRLGAEHEELMKRAIAGEDVETELKDKTRELKKAERDLETFCNAVIERGWGELGGLLIQGNLLTPMSQITNVGANIVNAIGKVAVDSIALPIERMVNMFGIDSPMKRNYSINAYMHGIRRFGVGFVEALDQIYTGQESDVSEWRMTRGFAPFRSLMSAMGKGDLPLGPDGKAGLNTRAKLFVQGTLGIPAEVMFRFLSLGDTPFRRYVEGIELYQMGRSQGLEGDALKNFLKYPTKKAREAAEREGRKLTYQEETIASRTADDFVKFAERMTARFFDWIPGTDGNAMARFLIRSNIPYRRTPANILYDTLTFATPYVAIPRMMAELKNGDARSASQTLAKSMIGGMVSQTTLMLIREGLISGAIEWNEDEERNMAYDQFPPNSINISGLKRWMAGGDAAKQEDDYFVSYMKLGILGTVMGSVVKGVDREELKKRDYSGDKWATHVIQDSFGIQAFSSIAHMMDQSFVQGMNNLVQVLSTGDERTWENWLGTTFQAMSATVLPNTMSAFYRAERDYLPDTRITKDMSFTERVLKKFEYTIKSRTFGLGELPIRRNWKGEKIEQTPRGTNGVAYQLFDITKARQGEADPVSNEIWRLYEETEDLTKACGTPGYAAKRKLNVPNISKKNRERIEATGRRYTWIDDEEFIADAFYLNTEQLNRLMEVSGKERYKELEEFMGSSTYASLSDEEKVEALNDINDGYTSAIEIKDGKFRNHTLEIFDIMQEVYDSERE